MFFEGTAGGKTSYLAFALWRADFPVPRPLPLQAGSDEIEHNGSLERSVSGSL